MSTSTTGSNELPRFADPCPSPLVDIAHERSVGRRVAQFRERMLQRHPWLAELLNVERASAWRSGFSAGMAQRLQLEHIRNHPDVPVPLITALQQGFDLDDPMGGANIAIDDLVVTITVTSAGTGIPEPDSRAVWLRLREIVRQCRDQAPCTDVIATLPREIAAIVWTDTHGQQVTVRHHQAG